MNWTNSHRWTVEPLDEDAISFLSLVDTVHEVADDWRGDGVEVTRESLLEAEYWARTGPRQRIGA